MINMSGNTILGGILPNIFIKRISLLNQGVLLSERNPHIDHEREPDVIRNRETGKIEREKTRTNIDKKSVSASSLKVSVDLLLKERLINDVFSTWFGDKDFKKYLFIRVLLSLDPLTTSELSTRKKKIEDYKSNNLIKIRTLPVKSLETVSNLDKTNSYLDQNGNIIHDVFFNVGFELQRDDPEHLSLFAVAYLDIESLIKDFKLDLPPEWRGVLSGKPTSELIIDESRVKSETYLFVDNQNEIWNGEVHQESNGRWKTGEIEQEGSEFLQLLVVVNNKVQDFRTTKKLKDYSLEFDILENSVISQIDQIKISNKDKIIPSKTPTYFSDFNIARDSKGNVRFVFGVDLLRLAKEQSLYGSMYRSDNKELLKNIVIKNCTVLRQRINPNKDAIKNNFGISAFNKEDPIEIVAHSKELAPGQFEINERPSGTIQELKLGLVNSGIRHFTGIDKEMSSITFGLYQYGVVFEIVDNTSNFIINLVSRLEQAKQILNSYYRLAVLPDNFNRYTSSFNERFIDEQIKQYEARPEIAPWILPIVIFLETLSILNSQFDDEEYSSFLFGILHPRTSSLEGLEIVLDLIGGLSNKLQTLVGSKSIKRSQQGSAFKDVSYNKSVPLKTYRLEKYFNTVFDSDIPKRVGYDFLTNGEIKEEPNSDGLTIISSIDFENRATAEILKYFKADNIDINIKTKSKVYTSDDTLENNKYAYFTPTQVNLGSVQNTEVPTINKGEGLFDDKTYRKLGTSVLRFNSLKKSPQISTFGFRVDEGSKLSSEDQQVKSNLNSVAEAYGITFSSPVVNKKFDTSKSNVVEDVSSDNPLVDANSIVGTGSAIGEDRIITEMKECELGGELGSSEQNPNSLLLATMAPIIEKGLSSNLLNNKAVQETTKKTNTIKAYDLNSSKNRIDTSPVNFSSLEIKALPRSINLPETRQNQQSQQRLGNQSEVSLAQQTRLKLLPNQIKSLLVSSVSSDKTVKNWFSEPYASNLEAPTVSSNKIRSVDPFKDPNKYLTVSFNYKIFKKIEVLIGYKISDDGLSLIKEPIWELMTVDLFNKVLGTNLLCRMTSYENELFDIKCPKGLELPVFNEYFVISSENRLVEPTIPGALVIEPELLLANVPPKTATLEPELLLVNTQPKYATIQNRLLKINNQQNIFRAEAPSSLMVAKTSTEEKAQEQLFTRAAPTVDSRTESQEEAIKEQSREPLQVSPTLLKSIF